MDIESKVWSLTSTSTGARLHAFRDGLALCSRAVRERSGPGEGFDYCEAEQGPFKLCIRCDAKFGDAVQAAEADETLKLLEEAPETPAPVACCEHEGMYHGARGCDRCPCTTPRNNPKKEESMGYDQRKRNGPLAPGQVRMIEGLVAGKRQAEVAKEMHVSPSHVSAEVRIAASRMGVKTTNAACALWGNVLAYLDAADLIERDVNFVEDERVAEVLRGLVKILRDRAAALTPS